MSDKERFAARWSRLKRERAKEDAAVPEKDLPQQSPVPPLPPIESLTPESNFSGFMAGSVQDSLRRAALKKLFTDPHFNGPDLFEPFSGDWTAGETIPQEMLATLNQARTVLFREEEEAAAAAAERQEKAAAAVAKQAQEPTADAEKTEDDGAGRQDA